MQKTEEILLSGVLDHAAIGIVVFDAEYLISYVNESFFAFHITNAFSKDELIGKDLTGRKAGLSSLAKEIKRLQQGESFEKELKNVKSADGFELKILVKATPIFNDEIFSGGVVIVEDLKTIEPVQSNGLNDKALLNIVSPLAEITLITNFSGDVILSAKNTSNSKRRPRKVHELFHDESRLAINKFLERLKNSESDFEEGILPLSDQYENKLVNIKIIPLSLNNANSNSALVLIKDISAELESKIALENELSELRQYQAITSTIVDAVIGISNRGEIKFWNESSEKLFGYTKSQVFGKFIGIIFPSIDEDYFQILREEILEKNQWEGELKVDKGTEGEEFYDVRIGVTGDEDNPSFVILCSSVTERYQVEQDLRQSEERFRNIVTNTHEYICTIDLDGRINYINPHFAEKLKYSENSITNTYFADLVDPEYLEEKDFQVSPQNLSEIESVELPIITESGEVVYVLASFSAVKDFDGKAKYFIAVLTDITEKKQVEKDLLLIKTVFEASQDGIAVTVDGRIILMNYSFVRMLNYKNEDELLHENIFNLIDEKDRPEVKRELDELKAGEENNKRVEFDMLKSDGSLISIADSIAKYDVDADMFFVSVLRDVTIEKKQQEKLRLSEERYRSITENIEESLWFAERKNENLKVVLYTQAIEEITGYSSEEFLEDDKLWIKIIHPDDTETVLEKIHRLYDDNSRNSDVFEYRIINKTGSAVWIENKINIIRDSSGEIEKIYGLVSDISINKKAEEELKKSADDLQKLNDTKDRFLSIISHDLRTPFSSILGFTDYLLSEQDVPKEKQQQYIQMIQDSSRSMLSLVNSLLDWTRIQTGRIKFEPERINVNTVINKSLNMLSGAALQKEIKLYSIVADDVFIHADTTLLLQVFNNLISNAIKFTKPAGEIKITAEPRVSERAFEFRVIDNGVGIKEEDKNKLFSVDAKFTTEGTSGEKGSGLGLSLVQEIIEKHGGEISVESKVGEGTQFIFSIPVSSMNILLVDDVKTDRILYSKLLKNFLSGYNIVEASNGVEAMEIIKTSPPAIVITDHVMPEMNGYELVKNVRMLDAKFKPPVIILSGDINDVVTQEYHELGIEYVFQKPVNLKQFKDALEKSLKKAIYH